MVANAAWLLLLLPVVLLVTHVVVVREERCLERRFGPVRPRRRVGGFVRALP